MLEPKYFSDFSAKTFVRNKSAVQLQVGELVGEADGDLEGWLEVGRKVGLLVGDWLGRDAVGAVEGR